MEEDRAGGRTGRRTILLVVVVVEVMAGSWTERVKEKGVGDIKRPATPVGHAASPWLFNPLPIPPQPRCPGPCTPSMVRAPEAAA